MAEKQSARGKLVPVDRMWTGPRFVILLALTLSLAMAILFTVASHPISAPDFSYSPFAHDLVKHTLESTNL